MKNKVLVSRIPVTDLINVLIHFEKKGKKYVDLMCSISDSGDGVHVKASKKSNKKLKLSKHTKLNDNIIIELLKHT